MSLCLPGDGIKRDPDMGWSAGIRLHGRILPFRVTFDAATQYVSVHTPWSVNIKISTMSHINHPAYINLRVWLEVAGRDRIQEELRAPNYFLLASWNKIILWFTVIFIIVTSNFVLCTLCDGVTLAPRTPHLDCAAPNMIHLGIWKEMNIFLACWTHVFFL